MTDVTHSGIEVVVAQTFNSTSATSDGGEVVAVVIDAPVSVSASAVGLQGEIGRAHV